MDDLVRIDQRANITPADLAKLRRELREANEKIAKLRDALHHIGYQSSAMSSVNFDWHDEWLNLRTEARAALEETK